MLKIVVMLSFLFFSINASAQCPFISGALMDAADVGLPAGEGKSEFIAFTTGSSSLAVNAFSVGYGASLAANDLTIDGSTISWQTLAVSPAITNSAGTITNIIAGSIPANTPVIILNSNNTISYDLATFGPNVYVLVFSSGTGVSGYLPTGRFANKSSPSGLRHFRVTAGACNNVVSYDKNAAAYSPIDGAGAKWNSAGVITYINTGSSGVVLPVNLISAKAYKENGKTILKWETAGNSSVLYFEIEKSRNGSSFAMVGKVMAESAQFVDAKAYSFIDEEVNDQPVFYRLRLVDKDNSYSFSPVMRLVERQSAGKYRIFPNPASSQIFIETASPDNYQYIIKDFSGRVLAENNFSGGSASINTEALPSGFYFLQLIGSGDIETHKIIRE